MKFIVLGLLAPFFAFSEPPVPEMFERSVYVEKATIWAGSDPGYSYKDCLNPKGAAVEVCQRRQAWPTGGEAVTIKRPIQIVGDNLYTLIKIDEKYGWVDAQAVDTKALKMTKDAYLYSQPGIGPKICDNLPDTPECTQRIPVKVGEKVQSFAPQSVRIKGDEYWFVEYSANGTTYTGWMAASAFSPTKGKTEGTQEAEGAEAPPPPPPVPPKPQRTKSKPPAPSSAAPPACQDCRKSMAQSPTDTVDGLNKAIKGSGLYIKDSSQFEKFACIHSRSEIYRTKPGTGFTKDQFCRHFADKKPANFRDQIKNAAQAFNLPESVIGCTLMIESGLYSSARESDEFRGYGQFGREAIADLSRYINMPEYKKMWKEYSPKRSTSEFNSTNVRIKDDVEITVGAVAFYLKWLLTNRLPLTACQDCSKNPNQPNQKDVYMAVAGYNWSPYGLGKIAAKTPAQLRSSRPPPTETRNYFSKMDYCLAPDNYDKFIGNKTNASFKERGEQCEGACP